MKRPRASSVFLSLSPFTGNCGKLTIILDLEEEKSDRMHTPSLAPKPMVEQNSQDLFKKNVPHFMRIKKLSLFSRQDLCFFMKMAMRVERKGWEIWAPS